MAQKIVYNPTKFYSRTEMAQMLGISKETFNKKIKDLHPILCDGFRKRLYSPGDVTIILEYIGVNISSLIKNN